MNKFKVGQKVKIIRTGKIGRINVIDDKDFNTLSKKQKYEVILLPAFHRCNRGMYKNMELGKEYTLEELGLKKLINHKKGDKET